jgi:predicted dehydrogenase
MTTPNRRTVLKTGAVGAAAALAQVASAKGLVPGGQEMLRVGLVGCGGRGTGAAVNALNADPNVKLVAMGDAFSDQLENSLKNLQNNAEVGSRVDVDEDHKFVGFDAYLKVIDSCDVVLLATSPHFRPLHVAAAVDAGKHLFVEKPVATDAPGVRSVMASAQKAKAAGLAMVSGLCYRYERKKQETVQRVWDGAIGDIVALQTTYNTNGLWHRGNKDSWSDMEYQMRNWLYFTWLSGDHITEQHIHSLDKIAWVMRGYPVKATASGGRSVRTGEKYGNIYDHFNTVYEWESGIRAFSSCRQWNGASTDVSDFVYGTKGKAALQRARIEGENPWRWRSDEPDDMYQNEHDALFAAIRSGEAINNGEYMCNSTLMAIMARMSAYTGQTVTWEEALNSKEDLSPATYAWTSLDMRPIARPGETKFV